MAHEAQRVYCNKLKAEFPDLFTGNTILDVGSLDINGNNRQFFTEIKKYIGVDLGAGNNVDIVCPIHEYQGEQEFDVVISTECFEHDKHWKKSMRKMYDLLLPNGAMIITAAGFGRVEHGTKKSCPEAAPFTHSYYRNVRAKDLLSVFDVDKEFSYWEISYEGDAKDIRFFGIKNFK
jgi:SAM-dependent methyltransferase